MEWECSHSISLYFLLHCSALELFPTSSLPTVTGEPTDSSHHLTHLGTYRLLLIYSTCQVIFLYWRLCIPSFPLKSFTRLLQSLSWVTTKTLQAVSLCICVPFMVRQLAE